MSSRAHKPKASLAFVSSLVVLGCSSNAASDTRSEMTTPDAAVSMASHRPSDLSVPAQCSTDLPTDERIDCICKLASCPATLGDALADLDRWTIYQESCGLAIVYEDRGSEREHEIGYRLSDGSLEFVSVAVVEQDRGGMGTIASFDQIYVDGTIADCFRPTGITCVLREGSSPTARTYRDAPPCDRAQLEAIRQKHL